MIAPVPVTDPMKQLNLPPGFRFYPTDEELMVQYLCRKVAGNDFPLQIIGDVDLYKFDPWDLPSKALFGEKEWYFFSPRDRKYPNGTRPNRVAGSGYWKATGTDKVIMSEGRKVGIKKALVFYLGKAPRGSKTNWIMHEYRLSDPPKKAHTLRLDDWVLCRIYKKNSSAEKSLPEQVKTEPSHNHSSSSSSSHIDDVLDSFPDTIPAMDDKYLAFQNNKMTFPEDEDQKVDMTANYGWANIAAYNGSSIDPTFDMQMKFGKSANDEVENGIRSQRMENSGYLFSQNFANPNDPFAIRYPAQSSGSGYRE